MSPSIPLISSCVSLSGVIWVATSATPVPGCFPPFTNRSRLSYYWDVKAEGQKGHNKTAVGEGLRSVAAMPRKLAACQLQSARPFIGPGHCSAADVSLFLPPRRGTGRQEARDNVCKTDVFRAIWMG